MGHFDELAGLTESRGSSGLDQPLLPPSVRKAATGAEREIATLGGKLAAVSDKFAIYKKAPTEANAKALRFAMNLSMEQAKSTAHALTTLARRAESMNGDLGREHYRSSEDNKFYKNMQAKLGPQSGEWIKHT